MTEAADMEDALSLERFARYVAWAGGDRTRALELYTLNTQLSEALYTPLQVLELALRNRVHTIMSAAHGERWFDANGLLQAPHQREQVQGALAELAKDNKEPLPGRVVAALTFSFWTAMLSPVYETLWRSTLSAIAAKPDGKRLGRKQLSRPLTPIRLLRNRIAHHEPILHWDLRKHHATMLEMTSWLSPPAARWCVRVDRFPATYPAKGYQLAADDEKGT
jgi:Abi-like protein